MNLDLKIDELAKLLGEKEIMIFVLRQKVAELEAQLAESAQEIPQLGKAQSLRPA